MYKLYTWYPWGFGRWVYRGEAKIKKTFWRYKKQNENHI